MKHTLPLAALVVAAGLALWGCNKEEAPVTENVPAAAPVASAPAPQPAAPGGYTGKVLETMDASGYTYVQVDTGSEKIWAAAPKFAVAVGDEVTVPPSAPMANYHSKTLDRTFDVVYFAGSIYPAGSAPSPASAMPAGMGADGAMPAGHPGGQVAPAATDVDLTGIAKAEGGNTVGELLGATATFGGKEVVLRGKVVKYNSGIMGKNWLHVQDGTGEAGANDLTVTTQAAAQVGDTVLVKGIAVIDKDFGYGYKYAFIIEDAQVTVE
ncbi:MAG: hypothetical protein P1P84_00105 [Deferrisomatales bacterium]|nr:hypothetical protein [Deferrisomatales bacterium]